MLLILDDISRQDIVMLFRGALKMRDVSLLHREEKRPVSRGLGASLQHFVTFQSFENVVKNFNTPSGLIEDFGESDLDGFSQKLLLLVDD